MHLLTLYIRALRLLLPEKGLAASLGLASFAIAGVQLAEPVLFGMAVDALVRNERPAEIISLWALVGIGGILASVVVSILADRLAHRRRLTVMAEAFDRAIALPLQYHAVRGSGGIVSTLQLGTENLFWIWLKVLREQVVAFAGVLFLIPTAVSVDRTLAVILLALAAAYVVMSAFVIRRTTEGQLNVESHRFELSKRVVDVIGNIAVVQCFARMSAESAAMRSITERMLSAQYPVLVWWGVLVVLQRAAATLTMIAIFVAGAWTAGAGGLTVGGIVSCAGLASLLIAKLDQLSGFVTSLHQGAAPLETFFRLYDETGGLEDAPGAKALLSPSGAVRFEGVSYRYPGSTVGVFDVELDVKPGSTLAIVGPTGSGKSTLLALLQQMRRADAGRILIGGQDIADVTLSSLRQNIAVVLQDPSLFNRSIADNIRIGNPSATDEEVERAAVLAEAHPFIIGKPDGYGSVVGERGAMLSGGERQRIAIARAILRNAPILLLDEATSALDVETEGKIKRALDALCEGRTTFIVAHRLSTVVTADCICVMDEGRIVEMGTYRELVANGRLFARMVSEGGFTVPQDEPDKVSLEEAAAMSGQDAVAHEYCDSLDLVPA